MTHSKPNPGPPPRPSPSQIGMPSNATAGRPGSYPAGTPESCGERVKLLVDQCCQVRRFTGRCPTATMDMLLDTVAEFDDLCQGRG